MKTEYLNNYIGAGAAAVAGARLAESPTQPRSIGLALDRLSGRTENLLKHVTELRNRLDPVLRQGPAAVESSTKQEQEFAPCLLACGIEVQFERVVSIEQIVLNLLDRLEL